MNTLKKLEAWFASQCDGDWEHSFGIRIDTLDNPGWEISVDLSGSEFEGRKFETIDQKRSESDWIVCRLEGSDFRAFGGPGNLEEMLVIFLNWAGDEERSH